MCLYQFLIAVRSEGAQLTTVDGETTRYVSQLRNLLLWNVIVEYD